MTKNNTTDDKIIKDAQYRKGLSIAFFNATNAAISLVSATVKENDETMLQAVVKYRNFFLEEHKNYYATVIANVGANYNSVDTIKKLGTAKTIEELKAIWLSLSEDERQNKEIIKTTNNLKKKYEKA